MRVILKYWYLIGFITLLFCSEDSPNNQAESENNQQAIIFFDKTIESFVDAEIPYGSDLINIYGTITSDELPEIEYIQLGDSLCTDFFDYQYNPGQITFRNKMVIQAIEDTFAIEVKSSHGIIGGEIELPDALVNRRYGLPDSLKKGDSLAVHWQQSNSDFYIIESTYYFADSGNNLKRFTIDTLTESNSFAIKSDILNYDGDLFINIYPVNGPYPQYGAMSNMQGGYLYAINKGSVNLIRVGNGLSAIPPLQKRIEGNHDPAVKRELILSKLAGK